MSKVNLSEFIENTLVEISKGVKGANEKINATKEYTDAVFNLRANKGDSKTVKGIEFDVGITAEKNAKGSMGLMVKLFSLSGGVSAEKGAKTEDIQRVKFEIGIDRAYDGISK
ncbi:MAG TPA: hypothetical protein DD412_06740 [Holosporales bacterium]|nr:hypothetical protein [Holosporales bacterium]